MSRLAILRLFGLTSVFLIAATVIGRGSLPFAMTSPVLAEEKKKEPVKINDIKTDQACTKMKSSCKQNEQVKALLRKAPPGNKPSQASQGSSGKVAPRK